MSKRYYWLKLKDDFFTTKEIKRLRKIAGGDTFVIIYLKMQLLSLPESGKLYFDGYEDSFVKELAMTLDEDEDNVEVTLQYLRKHNLLEVINEDEFILPQAVDAIASESESAERVRRHRAKEKMLQCNDELTEKAKNTLHCNYEVTENKDLVYNQTAPKEEMLHSNTDVISCNTDIDKDLDKDLDLNIDKEIGDLFEKFWLEYPKKVGKELAFRNWTKCMKSNIDANDLIQAAKNYAKEKEGVVPRYIKHPGNFLGEEQTFKSYLVSNYNPVHIKGAGSNSFNNYPQRSYSSNDYQNLERRLIDKSFIQEDEISDG